MLIIVNPISGKGKYQSNLDNIIIPYLIRNNIDYKIFISTRKNSITEYFNNFDNSIYNILLIGGDGSFFEILQTNNKELLDNLTVHLTSFGSGNGIFTSIKMPQYENFSLLNDKIENNQNLSLFDFNIDEYNGLFGLGISIGVISDVDLQTEWLRFMGNNRYDLGGIYYLLNTPSYKLKIQYTDENMVENVISGDFIQVFVYNVSHCSDTMLVDPDRKYYDDNLTLVLVPNTLNKCELTKLFLNMSEKHSSYLDNPKIEKFIIKKFTITPLNEKCKDSLTIDGEKFNFTNQISGSLNKQKLRIK